MKLQPAERILEISVPQNHYTVVDTAQLLSQINRKAYRQMYEYAYDKIELVQLDPSVQSTLKIYRFPQNWVTANAIVKAFKHWNAQQMEALRESGTQSVSAGYRDFKVVYNVGHATGSFAGGTSNVSNATLSTECVATLADAQTVDGGAVQQWSYSEFVVPNVTGSGGTTAEYIGNVLGDDGSNCKGLIKAYAESRARPQPIDPSIVGQPSTNHVLGGLYGEMQDVGEDLVEIIDNAAYRNNNPPYVLGSAGSEFEFYPGGSQGGTLTTGVNGILQDELQVRAGTGTSLSQDATGPFSAYCGLLWLSNSGDASVTVRVHVAAGTYQGVMARSMLEVN